MPKVYVPLAVMVLYPALTGCGAGETLTDQMMMDGEEPLGTTAQALVGDGPHVCQENYCDQRGQYQPQGALPGRKRTIRIGERGDRSRRVPGETQVLLSDSNNTLRGLCTVTGQAAAGNSNYYMATEGSIDGGFEARFGSTTPRTGITVSNRWSTTAPLHAIAEPAATLADLTTDTANKVMDFSDRARDTGTRGVLYAAAHPFETGSFNQIGHIHDTLDYQGWDTVWALGVKNQSATADAAFHITATEISDLSFPQLGAFMTARTRTWTSIG